MIHLIACIDDAGLLDAAIANARRTLSALEPYNVLRQSKDTLILVDEAGQCLDSVNRTGEPHMPNKHMRLTND